MRQMKNRRNRVLTLLTAGLAALMLSGCTQKQETETLHIVTTSFPAYDWTKQILGEHQDRAEVTFLLDDGVDMHSFQPSVQDILAVSSSDLFLYVGGESDNWAADALKEAVNPDLQAISLMEVLGNRVREEEIVEGMQTEPEHGHDDGAVGTDDHDKGSGETATHTDEADGAADHTEYDEHVWLSLDNAALFCETIADALAQADPDYADDYRGNAAAYITQLDQLDSRFRENVSHAPGHTLLFADRFPFRYLTEDYGLSYYAAFPGCSAESEASFETIVFLANKIDELNLNCILTIEKSDQRIAETISQNTQTKDQQILSLNSMQSVTAGEIRDGVSYLSVMERNLELVTEALQY